MPERVPSSSLQPQPGSAKVKGTLVITLLSFLRAKGLEPKSAIARLPDVDQALLGGILLPSGWYSAEMFARFVDVTAAMACRGPKSECIKEMGRFSAQLNLGPGGLRRAYVRPDDPHHVLSAISRIYRNVYSLGERRYEHTGPRSALIRGYSTRVALDHCAWVAGWLERVVELSGGQHVRVVEALCEAAGAAHCEYRIDWT